MARSADDLLPRDLVQEPRSSPGQFRSGPRCNHEKLLDKNWIYRKKMWGVSFLAIGYCVYIYIIYLIYIYICVYLYAIYIYMHIMYGINNVLYIVNFVFFFFCIGVCIYIYLHNFCARVCVCVFVSR